MIKLSVIAFFEYKLQIKRISGWILCFLIMFLGLFDSLPTIYNLQRVEFLLDINYFVRRILQLEGILLLFGLMFHLSGQLWKDKKIGIKELFMVSPISKWQYISGKLVGNFLYATTIMLTLLLLSVLVFFLLTPHQSTISELFQLFPQDFSTLFYPPHFLSLLVQLFFLS